MPAAGLEPARPRGLEILSPVRLPVPPSGPLTRRDLCRRWMYRVKHQTDSHSATINFHNVSYPITRRGTVTARPRPPAPPGSGGAKPGCRWRGRNRAAGGAAPGARAAAWSARGRAPRRRRLTSYGFTTRAPSRHDAAPAKRDSTRTPGSSASCATTYSSATRLRPSRSGVTRPTRASAIVAGQRAPRMGAVQVAQRDPVGLAVAADHMPDQPLDGAGACRDIPAGPRGWARRSA